MPIMLRFTGRLNHPGTFNIIEMKKRTEDIGNSAAQSAILDEIYQIREKEQAFEEGGMGKRLAVDIEVRLTVNQMETLLSTSRSIDEHRLRGKRKPRRRMPGRKAKRSNPRRRAERANESNEALLSSPRQRQRPLQAGQEVSQRALIRPSALTTTRPRP